jgi:hypothetical protein
LKGILDVLVPEENFEEVDYLSANQDVTRAVATGIFPNGRVHFDVHGRDEKRMIRRWGAIEEIRRMKKFLDHRMRDQRRGMKYDFLTEELECEIVR